MVIDPAVLVPALFELSEELCVPPVTEEPPGRVADGSEPTVETGLEPEVVEPDVLPVDPESVPVVDDELVDPNEELDDRTRR